MNELIHTMNVKELYAFLTEVSDSSRIWLVKVWRGRGEEPVTYGHCWSNNRWYDWNNWDGDSGMDDSDFWNLMNSASALSFEMNVDHEDYKDICVINAHVDR